MLSFKELNEIILKDHPKLQVTRMILNNWYDKNANIIFSGYIKGNKLLSTDYNKAYVVLSAVDGRVIDKRDLSNSHIIGKALSAFYFFHFIFEEGLITRIIYLLFGITFGLSMIFGIYIWLEKKASTYKNEINYISYISKFTTALTIGVIPSSTFLLFLYWVLPFDMENRNIWLFGGFHSFWAFSLFYSVLIFDNIKILKSFAILNGIFLILAVFYHDLTTNTFIWTSFKQNMQTIFWVDIALLSFALLSFLFAKNLEKINLIKRFEGV